MRLITDFGFSLEQLDSMIPFEREIYVALIKEDLEKKKNQNGST